MGGKSKQTNETKIDPAVMSRATENYDSNKTFAQTPVTPYTPSAGFAAAQGANSGLLNYHAPDVSTAQNVSHDQINHYMNPYLEQVVDATGADMEHARQVAQRDNAGAVAARGAFGNGRRGIYEAEIDSASQRNLGGILGQLRQGGWNTALQAGQGDLARILQAALANQNASLQSAGVRGQAVGNAGAQEGFLHDEFTRQQNDPLVKRGLLNQSLSSIPVPQTQTQTSSYKPGAGDIFQAGGGILRSLFMSDERLKTDVEELHRDDAGRRWVSYRYHWDEPGTARTGLMAQELREIEPWRVHETPSGYLAVDYAGLI